MPAIASDFGDITDYTMNAPPYGKTYRYWKHINESAVPLYPFGFGLSLSNVSFETLSLSSAQKDYCPSNAVCVTPKNDSVTATILVKNNSPKLDGATVVALFGSFVGPSGEPSAVVSLPTRQLLAHTKVAVAAGSSVEVQLQFKTSALAGALRQAWPGLVSCWVGHGMGLHPGTKRSHAGSVGEGTQPVFSNLTLVLPMVQEPSNCNPC